MTRAGKAAWHAVAAGVLGLGLLACGGADDPPEPADKAAAAPAAAAHVAAPAALAASAPSWTRIAVEGTVATVAPGQTVRYGFGDRWVERRVSGPMACTTAAFGRDPVPGVIKQCDLLDAAGTDAAGWQRFAWEYQAFQLSAPAVVRYGTGSRWIDKPLPAGEATCTTDLFEADPAPGLAKQCQVRRVTEAVASAHE